MPSHRLSDTISIHPNNNTTTREPCDHLLLFHITGNPGLAEYYRAFLSSISTRLADSLTVPKAGKSRKIATHVHTTSLAGFQLSSSVPASLARLHGSGPYKLVQQIDHIDLALARAVDDVEALKRPNETVRVVLTGHSVGSYILLEVLKRRQARSRSQKETSSVIGGILLFPTVVDLAKSPRGKIFSVVLMIPRIVLVLAVLAKLLTFWMPFGALLKLVRLATGMPNDAATTTTAFIKSTSGVMQALYLAKDELDNITADQWDDELWGVAQSSDRSTRQPKLFFYFGEVDHWVADETRDQLIAARASTDDVGQNTRPVMAIDREGVPHGFCIDHSEVIAEKVVGYVQDIVRTNWR